MRGIFVFAVLLLAAPAAGAEEAYFRTPSKNIFCGYFDGDDGASVRCDIVKYNSTMGERPADCDLDWGDSFEISDSAKRGVMVCHGDTVMSPDAEVLPYGESFERAGISCASETSGLTCQNSGGHGFFLSKAKQKIF